MRKYKLLKILAKIKYYFKETHEDYIYEKELRRKRIREISKELLLEPLSIRLEMLKKINDTVLIQSHKQRLEFEEMSEHWKKELDNFKI